MAGRVCIWKCRRKTKNRSRICDPCWQAAEQSRSLSDQGYKAWFEKKRAKTANGPKARSPKQQTHIDELNAKRAAELAKDLPATELLDG
jgi:hypothetical protein